MYDPEVTYKRFDNAYDIAKDYIKAEIIKSNGGSRLRDLYKVFLSIEDMKNAMLETETELLKRMVKERDSE